MFVTVKLLPWRPCMVCKPAIWSSRLLKDFHFVFFFQRVKMCLKHSTKRILRRDSSWERVLQLTPRNPWSQRLKIDLIFWMIPFSPIFFSNIGKLLPTDLNLGVSYSLRLSVVASLQTNSRGCSRSSFFLRLYIKKMLVF